MADRQPAAGPRPQPGLLAKAAGRIVQLAPACFCRICDPVRTWNGASSSSECFAASPDAQPDLTVSVAGLQAVAFSVVGVFQLAEGLSGLLAQLTVSVSDVWNSSVERFAVPLPQAAVGLTLFLGARRLATIWQSLRSAGRPSGDRAA
jgi:hypothetical protein